jgi:glycosyltransferase involved in cell wall biosynthesis
MKIALDLRRIGNPGIGRYMKCLTEALIATAPENEYLLILPTGHLDSISAEVETVRKLACDLKYYSVREQLVLPYILRQRRVEVLHAPHFNIPLWCPCACVVTIHDLIYLACRGDLDSHLGRIYYSAMTNAAVRLADKVITDSQFSRHEIRRWLKSDCNPEVIHPGIDSSFPPSADAERMRVIRSRYGINRDYILYTGIYKPRKNHAGLLRAFRCSLDRGIDAELVIAGPTEEREKELRRLAGELGITDRVIFTGFVPDSDLPTLYSGAQVYACPSLYEGFGFTVLEAMACGVPVVCSRESSLPEVAGTAAVYANARDASEFGEALCRVFTDDPLRAELKRSAETNIKRFTWRRAAMQTLAVYEQAVDRNVVKAADKRTGVCAG